jgi:hypothetical protein
MSSDMLHLSIICARGIGFADGRGQVSGFSGQGFRLAQHDQQLQLNLTSELSVVL